MRVFSLAWPGTWVDGMAPESGQQLLVLLFLAESHLADAALGLAMFDEARGRMPARRREGATEGDAGVPEAYLHRLPFVHARTVLFALDGIQKALEKLAELPSASPSVAEACGSFARRLPLVKALRDSAHHPEDRIRGMGKNEKKLDLQPVDTPAIRAPSGAIVVDSLFGTRYGGTLADGTLGEVEVTEASVALAQASIQEVLDTLAWRGPPRRSP